MLAQAIVTLALDVILALLLAVTISYCWKLNRRIAVLQDSKGDMAQLIRQFDMATEKAAESIGQLQNASQQLQEDMQARIQKANFIADDLAFMIDRGNKVAEKMLGGSGVREAAPAKQSGSPNPAPSRGPALPNNPAPEAAAPRGPRVSTEPRPGSALDSVMERLSKGEGPASPLKPAVQTARPRSKAEQDLMNALKNDR